MTVILKKKIFLNSILVIAVLYLSFTGYHFIQQNIIHPDKFYYYSIELGTYAFSWIVCLLSIIAYFMFIRQNKIYKLFLNFVFLGLFVEALLNIFLREGGDFGLFIGVFIPILLAMMGFIFYYRIFKSGTSQDVLE